MATEALPLPDSNSQTGALSAHNPDVVVDCNIRELYYGNFKAVRDTVIPMQEARHHGIHRALGLRQEHGAALHQPHERSGARLPL